MTISYNCHNECWEDEDDPTWIIDMTPEGKLPDDFETRTDFYNWYVFNDIDKQDNGPCWDIRAIYVCIKGQWTGRVEESLMVFKDGSDLDDVTEDRRKHLQQKFDRVLFLNYVHR
jgi:hypothetical protein